MTATIELAPESGGVTDHGLLTGLADDDHPQYALADGSRGDFATPADVDAVAAALDDEQTAREDVDAALGIRIDDEETARGGADAALDSRIDALEAVDPLTELEADGIYRRQDVALLDADIPAAIARDSELATAIANEAANRDAAIDAAVALIMGGAPPAAVNAIFELAAALNNDPNFATTIAAQIGAKLAAAGHTANSVPVSVSGALVDLAVPTSSVLGRKAAGDVVALTMAELKTLLAIAAGDVSGLGALAVLSSIATGSLDDNAVTMAKLADSAEARIFGRAAGAGTGDPQYLTAAQVKTLLALVVADIGGISAFAQTLLDDTTAAAMRSTLELLPIAPGLGSSPDTSVPTEISIDVLIDVQEFAVAGAFTWNPPAWADASCVVDVVTVGGGGGGGGGRRGAASSVRGGGGGGAAGNRARESLLLGDLATPVNGSVGAAGNAGAVAAGDSTDGGDGGAGGPSYFGKYVYASGGLGGAKGTSVDGGAGGTNGTRGSFAGNRGAKGAGLANAEDISTEGLLTSTISAFPTGGGGGGGGGRTASNGTVNPSNGGPVNGYTDGTTAGGLAGVGPGFGGGNGSTAQKYLASGGGGGFLGNAVAATAGGNGAAPGGGGGGGGASTNSNASGAGGTGGVGYVRVIVHR